MNKKRVLIITILLGLCAIFYGCGHSDNNDDDWGNSRVIRVSNLKGRVIAPINDVNSMRAQTAEAAFSLVSVANTRVFLEDDSSKFAVTDANGDFLIPNVPEGPHRIIANALSGTTTYRQRSDLINVTGQYETQLIERSIELQPAFYDLTIHLSDLNTGSPVNGRITVWGYTFEAVNGICNIGPFPGGSLSKEAEISAVGYISARTLLNFSENNKSESYINLTPTTNTDPNQAPVVEIHQDSLTVRTNEEINLSGVGYDRDGDPLTWEWSADKGSFYNSRAQQTIYEAPDKPGTVRISLRATDSKGAVGSAILSVTVEQGSGKKKNPQNQPPVPPNTPYPEDLTTGMGGELLLTWKCSDPNGDELTYTINFGTQTNNMKILATDLSDPSYVVKGLEANTRYFWRVTAYDEHYESADSELWQFTTGDLNNQPPTVPTLPQPENMASNIEGHAAFSWSGGDPDGDAVTYHVMLATISTWIESEPTSLSEIYNTNLLKYDYYGIAKGAVYQWQIIAVDSHGARTEGPVWLFSTVEPENNMPSFASAVEPGDGATNISVKQLLSWNATDLDGDTLYFDVYFGTDSEPELVSASQTNLIYNPGTLQNNTKYYWRVVVSDGRKTNPRSDIWSFTTEEIVVVKPEVVSVTEPVETTDPLKIVFNKYIDKAKQEKAFTFSPEVEGTWTWKNDNTVAEFKPTGGSWLPGSYNKFKLVANVLTDDEGNPLAKGEEKAFTISSKVPVPMGYHSYAFPMSVPANTTVKISVPDLDYGMNSYVLAIADADNTSAVVASGRASMNNDPSVYYNTEDPTYGLRLQEARTMSNPVPVINSSARASVNAAEVGESREFYINSIATSTSYPKNKITATLAKASGNTVVYLDDAITDSNRDEVAANVLSKFDNQVIQRVRNAFGDEPPLGLDGESRIAIVLFKLPSGNTTAGYFSSADLYPAQGSGDYRISNQCKVIYIKYGMADVTTFATLAHEFQHMVNYYQKNKTLQYSAEKVFEETWLNEAMSKYSEEVCGFGLFDGDANTPALINLSTANNDTLALTAWNNPTINNYGQVFLFGHFLAQPGRYNSDSSVITKAIVNGNNGKSLGEANVENVTGEPFKETMAKWALSCFLNNHSSTSPTAYGIYNIDLRGTYSGIKLDGYTIENITNSISLSGMKKNAMRCFRKASPGDGDTTITVSTGRQPITLWCFDEREQ